MMETFWNPLLFRKLKKLETFLSFIVTLQGAYFEILFYIVTLTIKSLY
jgi:hypothetical protein